MPFWAPATSPTSPEFTAFGFSYVPGTQVPWTLLAFLLLAVVFWAGLHLTWIGRQIFAIGKNKDTARYSGVRVATLRMALFAVSGMVAAFAGIVLALRYNSVRADNGSGLVLTVVMIAVLGGVDINGGKGTIPGVILAVFTLAALQSALRLAGISSEYQNVAIGLLLIVSVIAPNLLANSGCWQIAFAQVETDPFAIRCLARSFGSVPRRLRLEVPIIEGGRIPGTETSSSSARFYGGVVLCSIV